MSSTALDSVHEDHICAGLYVGQAPSHGVLPPGDGVGITSCDDGEVRVGAGVQGCMNLLYHLLLRYHLLALEETALLGKHLVFNVNGRHPCILVLLHCAPHVDGVAISRVGVAHHRHRYRLGYVPGVLDHLRLGQEAHVGEALFCGGARPGHVYCLKARRLGDLGVERVQHERGHHHLVRA